MTLFPENTWDSPGSARSEVNLLQALHVPVLFTNSERFFYFIYLFFFSLGGQGDPPPLIVGPLGITPTS